jgi:hypothetical protein
MADEDIHSGGLSVPQPIAHILGFAVQSAVGVATFLAIYVAALMLGVSLRFLNRAFGAEQWLVDVAVLVERLLVYVDVGLFMLFLLREIATYVRRLVREWREG